MHLELLWILILIIEALEVIEKLNRDKSDVYKFNKQKVSRPETVGVRFDWRS